MSNKSNSQSKMVDEEFKERMDKVLRTQISPKTRLEHFRRKLQEGRALNDRRQ